MQEDYLRILRYFRFVARISPDPSQHPPDTEEALRENMKGLSGVSGERIWIELKQILSSKHAGTLMETMIRLGMGPYIGLAEDLDMTEFKAVWQRASSQQIKLYPVTLLSALLSSDEAVRLEEL